MLKEDLEAICFGNRILFWGQQLCHVQGKLNYTSSPIPYNRPCHQRTPTWQSVRGRKTKANPPINSVQVCRTTDFQIIPQTRILTALPIWKPTLQKLCVSYASLQLFENIFKSLTFFLPSDSGIIILLMLNIANYSVDF